ncbi:MAG: cell division protein ZapE [Pseudomonadota bacterium]|nr:cell division protein ZapE [Pseudomonadota bacterium]
MPLKREYKNVLSKNGFISDPSQLEIIEQLNKIYLQLCDAPPAGSWKKSINRKLPKKLISYKPIKGLYIWGDVGRGKTFIMDIFFASLPFDDKLRYHFHRLMYRIHKQLHKLKGESDPIEIIADGIANQARVICFDEFFVEDIGDAMLLGKFLQALFDRGVCLITTSNIRPDDLYLEGLQRDRFLPAIALIKKQTEVIKLNGENDYRLRLLEENTLWHYPDNSAVEKYLDNFFSMFVNDGSSEKINLEILGRDIPIHKRSDGVVWFEFKYLCGEQRSQNDYIEIARAFQTVLVSNVPILQSDNDNEARRFIALVDEFYDRRVKVCISAAASINNIYQGNTLIKPFQRTASRLHQMQSTDYLSQAHLA